MFELPKTKEPEKTDLCRCYPLCKNRRREWNGKVLKTSDELLIERKPLDDCMKRWPKKTVPNGPCPLFAKTKKVFIKPIRAPGRLPKIVRICDAPIDDRVPTPYLKSVEYVRQHGVEPMVKTCCLFCSCGGTQCCPCGSRVYSMRDPERKTYRKADMKEFDNRVKHTYDTIRAMYMDY